MDLDADLLRDLARLEDEGRTVLSCYVALGERGWEEVHAFLDEEEQRLRPLLDGDEAEFFELAIGLLRDFMAGKQEAGTQAPGLAFFAALGSSADAGDGFSRGLELPAAPDPLLALDRTAVLAPLALLTDKLKPIGLIVADNAGARILLASGELVEDAEQVKGDVKNHVKVGGWSQARYQRRRANQVKDLAEDVVKRAVELFEEAGVERVALAGRTEMTAALADELPKAWADKVIGTLAFERKDDDQALLARLRPLAEEAERHEAEAVMDTFVAEVRRGGLAVAGRRKTRAALEMAAVDTLLLGLLLEEGEREELVALAQASGAAVEFVPEEASRLKGYGEVGALLRFPLRLG